ncbi:PREDICTED: cytochrome P450 9e2-like [Nicrophorus vespilloides]|uniref:Cytochrome P450 9e2-like n=1 Tax=Nicrophorus vespilloides TaxID=110193 RepID=A0ABM1MTG9_NICVS|nr:PREDICTED: cytochrome P450 9e2-like [Nicrophorus vespilloides]
MIMVGLLIALLLVLIYVYVSKRQSFWKNKGVKHIKPVFLFGDIFRTATQQENFSAFIHRLYNQFKNERYFGCYQFTTPILIINDLELIKKIGIKSFDHFHDHPGFPSEEIDPLWSKNLAASTGEKWRKMRTTLSPSFTSSKMKLMFNLITNCAEEFVLYFKEQQEDVITVEMKDIFTRYTNDVIATSAFGIKCDSLRNKDNEFYKKGLIATDFSGLAALKLLIYQVSPMLTKLLKIKIIPEKATNFFGKVIKDSIKMREEQGIVRPDMIHLLMEARKGNMHDENVEAPEGFAATEEGTKVSNNKQMEITDEDIIAQALIFFLAGFDTSSTLMCYVAYELAINLDIQAKLRENIMSTDEKCNGKITYEALMKMKYLDMVISETLRKWPPTPATDRICVKDYTIPPERPDEKPLVLAKGSTIWFPIYGLHRDPNIFEDPERFDPERFSDENKSKIDPTSFISFGIGPRNCIGSRFALMETKILIYHIIKHFEIVPVKKSVIPVVLSKKHFNMTVEGGMWFGLKKNLKLK